MANGCFYLNRADAELTKYGEYYFKTPPLPIYYDKVNQTFKLDFAKIRKTIVLTGDWRISAWNDDAQAYIESGDIITNTNVPILIDKDGLGSAFCGSFKIVIQLSATQMEGVPILSMTFTTEEI